jgi:acetolactate synthase-1/2/3 large subunit
MVDALWAQLKQAKQPLLWLGGGALESGEAVKTLADAGVTVISAPTAAAFWRQPSRQPARVS